MKKIIVKIGFICILCLFGIFNSTIQIGSEETVLEEQTTEEVTEPIKETRIVDEIIQPIMLEKILCYTTLEEPESTQEEITEAVPLNKWGIELTEDEIDMLAKIVFLEAHTESEEGVLAVVEVIFNRMISDDFPNTLEDVLSQENPVQFTTWKNIDMATPTEKEYNMIYAALNGEKEVLSTEYVFFSRRKQNDHDPIQLGNHWFCKGNYY